MPRSMRAVALATLALATLTACDRESATTLVQRSTTDGVHTIHVETRVVRDVATFACLTSRTGQCRIVVFIRECDIEVSLGDGTMGQDCTTRALGRFELRTGERHAVRGLPHGFKQCSAVEAMPVPPACDVAG
jgi:hypothetical protein